MTRKETISQVDKWDRKFYRVLCHNIRHLFMYVRVCERERVRVTMRRRARMKEKYEMRKGEDCPAHRLLKNKQFIFITKS